MSYPMIAARVFGTPLLVDPAKGAAFLAGLGPRLVNGALELRGLDGLPADRLARAGRIAASGDSGLRASILADDVGTRARGAGRRLYRLHEGVAVIEVTGTLVHRGDYIGESSGTTSYEGLAAQVTAAAGDPTVKGIALEIDTFGGEVAGAFDLADAIRTARAHKPVRAFVAEAALSAGYVLAAQAGRIVLPRTGEVGSIGVLTIHADYSQRLADEGVAVTLIYAGAHKVDGNPYEALPEAVRADLQGRVEHARTLFAETVAAGRGGRLGAQAALATEAQVFQGAEAVAAGLADEVADLRSAFAAFVAEVNRPRASAILTAQAVVSKETPTMTNPVTQTTIPSASSPGGGDAATEVQDVETADTAESGPVQTPGQSPAPTPAADTPAAATTDAAQATISRVAAAELAEVAQIAGRLGVSVDLADAIGRGLSADQVRKSVLSKLASNAQQADVVVATPAAGRTTESPLVSAARRTAETLQAQAQRALASRR